MSSSTTVTVSGIECPHCLQRIWSRHRHDCRSCFCEYCYVDGGRDYLRSGYGGPDWPVDPVTGSWTRPKIVDIEIEVTQMPRREPRWPY